MVPEADEIRTSLTPTESPRNSTCSQVIPASLLRYNPRSGPGIPGFPIVAANTTFGLTGSISIRLTMRVSVNRGVSFDPHPQTCKCPHQYEDDH